MYLPAHFRVDDYDTLTAFIEENSFATLVTFDGAAPFATHLPLLFDKTRGAFGTLSGHVARGNAQWKQLQNLQHGGGEALAIFHGPHAYISPSWYEAELAVPTWNYAAVHAYGIPRLLSDEELAIQLRAMIQKHESGFPSPWPGDLPDDFQAKLRLGIVGFDIEISRLEGKWKLNQNRSEVDRNGVITALECSPHDDDRAIAALMKK
jgi:transcriptional regulator